MTVRKRPAPELSHSTASHLAALVERRQFSKAVDFFEHNRSEIELLAKEPTEAAAVAYHAAVRAYASMSENRKALKLGRIAEATATKCRKPLLLAEVFITIGGILRDLNEMNAAHKAFQDAESLFRRFGSPEGQCRALNKLAGLYYHRNDFRNALSVLMDAVEIARQLDDRRKLAFMMGNIGRIHLFTGELGEAKKHLTINIKLSEELGDDLEAGRAYLSLGYLYIQMEDFPKASEALESARVLINAVNSKRDEVIYLTYLGELCYRQGDFEQSRKALDSALSLVETSDADIMQVGTIHRHLAELYLRMNRFRIARRHASRGISIMRKSDNKVELGALYKISALISAESGKEQQGRRQMHKALDLLEESGVRWEKAEALVASGGSTLFNRRQRMTHLFRAEEFFVRSGMTVRLSQVARHITMLESESVSLKDQSSPVEKKTVSDTDFLTRCPEIISFKKQLPILARADLPLLLTGETGVGKDHMARYYHSLVRPDGPFIAINCASVPESLLESELFGYSKGAFTGASGSKSGLFVEANGGVLLLDEIGDMPLALQTKLLGVLERRKVIPLGSTQETDLDILVVAASNCDLEQMTAEGRFRRDLYYRLSGITFEIPPLRARKEDIALLVERFMHDSKLLSEEVQITPELLNAFLSHDWPGNVRELYNRVKRLEILCDMASQGDLVELTHSLFGNAPESSEESRSLFERVEKFECDLITQAILLAGGNKSKAARILGVHEATVRTKVKRYGISIRGGDLN